MKLSTVLCIVALSMVAFASCAPKATMDECTAACKKKAVLEAAAAPAAAPEESVASIDAIFQQKIDDLENQKNQAIQALDQELEGKLGAAKDDPEKTALTEEYTSKKDEKAKEFQPLIEALNQQKVDGVKAAQEKLAQAEEQKRIKAEAALKACADACFKARTTKAKATCQTGAATIEAFNKCK